MINVSDVRGGVERELLRLHSLKMDRIPGYYRIREEARMKQRYEKQDYADYHMNTGFAITNAKRAELLASTPKFDFVGLDEEGRKTRQVKKLMWDYVWKTSGTDGAIWKIVTDALDYGVGFGLETITEWNREVSMPTFTEDGISFEKRKMVEDYCGPKLEYVPWEYVWVNGTDMENATKCVVVSYHHRDEFRALYGNSPFYEVDMEKVPMGKHYYVGQDGTLGMSPKSDAGAISNIDMNMVVTVLRYFDKSCDEYVVLANGTWINPVKGAIMPIPYAHKQLPLIAYFDHQLNDTFFGAMGEYEISAGSRALKDAARSVCIEGCKAQAGIVTISPTADFDEVTKSMGTFRMARVDKEDIGFFAPQINLSSAQYIEAKCDEDIIVETGVDFRSQVLGPNETATKTAGRIDAAKRRINAHIRNNAYSFYERFARLRMANISTYYSEGEKSIPVKGMDVDSKGNVRYLGTGYGLFTAKPEFFLGKTALFPMVDSMGGDSTSEQKQKYMETITLLGNMKDKMGAPLFDPKKLIEAGRGIIDDAIDIDKLLEKNVEQKSPEEILAAAEGNPLAQNPAMDGNMVPPEQRSGAPVLLPSSPNVA